MCDNKLNLDIITKRKKKSVRNLMNNSQQLYINMIDNKDNIDKYLHHHIKYYIKNEHKKYYNNDLLKYNINSQDDNGNTPLHIACANHTLHINYNIEWLLQNNADINIQNKDGDIPLHVLWKQNKISSSISLYLLSKKSNIHIKNKEGKKPYDYIIDKNEIYHSDDSDVNKPKMKATYKNKDYLIWQLIIASYFVDDKIITKYINKSNKIPTEDKWNLLQLMTFLFFDSNTYDQLNFNGIDINYQNIKGDTALHIACHVNLQHNN